MFQYVTNVTCHYLLIHVGGSRALIPMAEECGQVLHGAGGAQHQELPHHSDQEEDWGRKRSLSGWHIVERRSWTCTFMEYLESLDILLSYNKFFQDTLITPWFPPVYLSCGMRNRYGGSG